MTEEYELSMLISWWSNLESKWDDHPNESYLISDEWNFVLVFKGDHDW
jgi:hypothetical protein